MNKPSLEGNTHTLSHTCISELSPSVCSTLTAFCKCSQVRVCELLFTHVCLSLQRWSSKSRVSIIICGGLKSFLWSASSVALLMVLIGQNDFLQHGRFWADEHGAPWSWGCVPFGETSISNRILQKQTCSCNLENTICMLTIKRGRYSLHKYSFTSH